MPLKQHPTDPDKMVYASRQYDIPQLQGVTTAQPAQEPTLQEQLDKTYAKWNKDGAELLKAYAEIKRTRVTCIINDGINTPPPQEKNNG
jgi:hypothetical protein